MWQIHKRIIQLLYEDARQVNKTNNKTPNKKGRKDKNHRKEI